MNWALWRKAVADAWRQLLVSGVLLALFGWLFVWLISQFRVGFMPAVLDFLPKFVEPMMGVPLRDLATTPGRLSFLYIHVVTLLVMIGWAVGRGSGAVSGEIGRGTMDLILALPIRRATVLLSSGVVATAGAAVLACCLLLGNWIGIQRLGLAAEAPIGRFVPGAVNLFAMIFCMTGLTTLLSSWDRDRWRTILWAGGLFIASSILKFVARLWEGGAWLRYLSFLSGFEPQRLILLPPEESAPMAWQYNGTLLGLGLAGYLIAAAVFTYRDIPQAH